MRYRTLGRTGLNVSEIGYGAWGIGGNQWRGGEDSESSAALHRAIERGVNFIDTALAYNEGHSERLIAPFLKEAPHPIIVATKVPPMNRIWPARPGVGIEEVFPADYIVRCTETSLRNLGVDTIDVQQLHVWNPEWVARDEWRRGLDDIKRSGKVKFVGISINDHQPDSALELIETGLIDTVQVIYNVFDPTPQRRLYPLCRERNIGVIARCPLDEGALTGTITEQSDFDPSDFRAHYFRNGRKREVREHVERLQADLGDTGESLAETALRFCLSSGAVGTVIPGMRRVRNVEMNCRVSEKGPLDGDVLATLARHAWDKNFYA